MAIHSFIRLFGEWIINGHALLRADFKRAVIMAYRKISDSREITIAVMDSETGVSFPVCLLSPSNLHHVDKVNITNSTAFSSHPYWNVSHCLAYGYCKETVLLSFLISNF